MTFCETIFLAGQEEAKWWRRVNKLASKKLNDPRKALRALGIEANESTLTMLERSQSDWPGFTIQVEADARNVTLYSSTCHDFEVLVCVLQAFAAQFCPGLIFGVTWSDNTPGDTPSGGILIVTKDEYICESSAARREELINLARKMKGY